MSALRSLRVVNRICCPEPLARAWHLGVLSGQPVGQQEQRICGRNRPAQASRPKVTDASEKRSYGQTVGSVLLTTGSRKGHPS